MEKDKVKEDFLHLGARVNKILNKVAEGSHITVSEFQAVVPDVKLKFGRLIEKLDEVRSRSDLEGAQSICQVLHTNTHTVLSLLQSVKKLSSNYQQSLYVTLTTSFTTLSFNLTLCKEVELSHNAFSKELTNCLGPLFRTSFTLLKEAVEVVEQIKSHELIADVLSVMSSLLGVAKASLHFDPSVVMVVWRGMGRLVCRLKEHGAAVDAKMGLTNVLSEVCEAMVSQSAKCMQCYVRSGKDGGFYVKVLKTCRFLATLIVKFIQEYEMFMHEFANIILQFILSLFSDLPPSPTCPKVLPSQVLADIEANIQVIFEPLVSSFMNCETFLSLCITPTESLTCHPYIWCLLLSTLLKFFPNLQEHTRQYLLESVSSREDSPPTLRLLDAVFECVRNGDGVWGVSVYPPKTLCDGSTATLYELLCARASILVATLPAAYFTTMEAILLNQLFSDHFHVSLLAADIWCFMARWGSSDLCYSHFQLLSKLVMSLPLSYHCTTSNVRTLAGRLFKLLTQKHQFEVLERYPVASVDNVKLWSCISVGLLATPPQNYSSLLNTCALQLTNPDITVVFYSLVCISDLLLAGVTGPTSTPLCDRLVQLLIVCVPLMATTDGTNDVILSNIISLIFRSLSALLTDLTHQQFHTVLGYVCLLLEKDLPTAVYVGVAHFCSHCGKVKDRKFASLLTTAFQLLLAKNSNDGLCCNTGLEAFKKFAELTPHGDILEKCIPQALNDVVVCFLQKVPHGAKHHNELLEPCNVYERVKRKYKLPKSEEKSRHDEDNKMEVIVLDSDHDSGKDTPNVTYNDLEQLLDSWRSIRSLPRPLPAAITTKLRTLWEEVGVVLSES